MSGVSVGSGGGGGGVFGGERWTFSIDAQLTRLVVRLRLFVLPRLRPRGVRLLPRLSYLLALAGGFLLGGFLLRLLLRFQCPAFFWLGPQSVYRCWQSLFPVVWSPSHRHLGMQAWSGARAGDVQRAHAWVPGVGQTSSRCPSFMHVVHTCSSGCQQGMEMSTSLVAAMAEPLPPDNEELASVSGSIADDNEVDSPWSKHPFTIYEDIPGFLGNSRHHCAVSRTLREEPQFQKPMTGNPVSGGRVLNLTADHSAFN
ncbi:hypothetical protein HPB47_023955 [Ixodes persulcatus]|uniref:Uncharacterized protein n=1 Tax=Ixodes persulcatus TaxID=34615 RepID=A0AC60Q824_IXOPE|nr:hypothetical protein HPB47_023955 [Ixodes persulcatus]